MIGSGATMNCTRSKTTPPPATPLTPTTLGSALTPFPAVPSTPTTLGGRRGVMGGWLPLLNSPSRLVEYDAISLLLVGAGAVSNVSR